MHKAVVGGIAVLLVVPLVVVILFSGEGCASGAEPGPSDPGLNDGAIGNAPDQIPDTAVPWAEKAANSGQYRYPVAFVAADMFAESGFDPAASVGDSNGGTKGLTQINNANWRHIYGHDWNADTDGNGTPDIEDPLIHAEYAAKLWDEQIEQIHTFKHDHPDSAAADASDLELLLIAHNAGFSRVKDYPDIPDSTRSTYIPKIAKWAKEWGGLDITTTNVTGQPKGADPQAGGDITRPHSDLNLGPVKPHVEDAAEVISDEFGITDIGGYRSSGARDPNGHPVGLAIDVMVGRDEKGKKHGDKIAQYVIDNHTELNVKDLIWNQQIMNVDRGETTWEDMDDRGSDTQNHKDHVHISFTTSGDEAIAGGGVDMPDQCPAGGGDDAPTGGKNKPGPWGGHDNGRIPTDELAPIPWAHDEFLRTDATDALVTMNNDFKKKFGTDMGITDAYRDYEEQEHLYQTKPPGMAATPGKSNHGWALAVDFGTGINRFGTPQHKWMKTNAEKYGWQHPDWARQGQKNSEAWHWEYYGLDT